METLISETYDFIYESEERFDSECETIKNKKQLERTHREVHRKLRPFYGRHNCPSEQLIR